MAWVKTGPAGLQGEGETWAGTFQRGEYPEHLLNISVKTPVEHWRENTR